MKPQALLACGAVALAQQVYIPAEGPVSRPQCVENCTYATAVPQYTFREFSFTQTETVRTAKSIPAPTATTTYAPPYASLSSFVPNLTTTQWGNWYPNASVTATDTANPYGNASWSALWSTIPWVNFTRGIYSTTVSPTPVPTSELILPPPEPVIPQSCYYFPKDFMLGVAASAVQIEGAIADEGRTPVHNDVGTLINPGQAPNWIANENYYLYKQDIERIAAMGVKYYRFSVPWTRILPFILPGTPVNEQGLAHYDELINFVLEKGMLPALMIYHNDSPFQFYNGNISSIFNVPGTGAIGYLDSCFQCSYKNVSFEDAFVNYGKILMTHFADRVPIWWSFNEPLLGARNGKSIDAVIKAHARLSHFYHDEIKGTGKISLTFNDNFGVPKNPQDPADVDAANHFNSFQLATFSNPIFLGIDYPESFKSSTADYVPLSAEDLAYINGTADFYSIQPYTATVVSPPPNDTIANCAANITHPLRPYCVTQETTTTTGWNIGYRSQSYSPVAVTEFGFPVFAESQKAQKDQEFDSPRSQYYQTYLNEGLKAIWEDGVQFVGAFAWSWADNWEFGDYAQQFGIQTVNRTTMVRRYKKSFFDYVDFIESRRQKA
ncbi:BglB Beta-glucosidase 6-phospho-beta-glucosidase beta-galactosidase [Pyrenophora tritici-repentis]|uniref:BglB, Beta-glucosidase-6-phospho-beta-glucosidase-beta-galactosidase n=1 Tax=Pyrenophora tritici-repentis TaxID=45151 RepID=A0A2W1HS27_9PLEO|nr:Glycoside hydrolase family 1 protein [Pyrenophora tritici-repentis]KAF7450758.1 Glycoside hydrolase family 1 protein [Pyrenophora tritici-repentis]KAF7573407.1 BglB, Beta-glucosidase-6-phospho-beta-glucosidase-beta- galactosidase [Pyrenophora tritici-repentis]KAI0581242.1 Glycoside hydrolase family 1 protein [Pyrenophora tritici-repentis]KAI0609100.1 Glycoside hydrolase family 1 protein [Pyrenophora tritici-repentis]